MPCHHLDLCMSICVCKCVWTRGLVDKILDLSSCCPWEVLVGSASSQHCCNTATLQPRLYVLVCVLSLCVSLGLPKVASCLVCVLPLCIWACLGLHPTLSPLPPCPHSPHNLSYQEHCQPYQTLRLLAFLSLVPIHSIQQPGYTTHS